MQTANAALRENLMKIWLKKNAGQIKPGQGVFPWPALRVEGSGPVNVLEEN
jgi:hypothetical protein